MDEGVGLVCEAGVKVMSGGDGTAISVVDVIGRGPDAAGSCNSASEPMASRKCLGVGGVPTGVVVWELEISVGVTGTTYALNRPGSSDPARFESGFINKRGFDEMTPVDCLVVEVFIESFKDSCLSVGVLVSLFEVVTERGLVSEGAVA